METKSTVPFLRISSSSGIIILQLLLDSVLSIPYSVALSPHRLWPLLRQLAQKELGEKVGFSSKTADSRIRKYEKNIMAPKTEIRNKLADALDVDLSALSDINIQTYEDVMHTLFLFEEEFDMDIDRTEEKTTLSFDNHNKKIAPLITYLYTWHCNKNLLFFMIFLL